MERLTEWKDDKKLLAKAKFSGDFGSQNILQSLAEYEDLEELIGIPLKNLAEICKNKIPEECRNPNKAIVLTDEDVDRWNGYRDLEDRLHGISINQVVDGFIKTVENQTHEGYENGRILTNEDADRWNEYKNEEEQGLLLRFPCKVGDTVYAICTCEAVDTVLDGTLYGSNGVFGTATGYYCPYELSDKCPHTEVCDCEKCKNIENVFEDTVDYISITECEILIGLKNTNLCVTVDDFGKTIFITKEEAEQKLKEMESD